MNQFLGTHLNRLDAKGRVSIPAPYRAALRTADVDAPVNLVLRRSHKFHCIEAWPVPKYDALARTLEKYDPLSDEYDERSAVIFTDAFPVEADKEGRILLPTSLVEYASLSNQVAFYGRGDTFQVWEPDAGNRRQEEARTGARLRDQGRSGAAA